MDGLRISFSHLSVLHWLFARLGNHDESHDNDWEERVPNERSRMQEAGYLAAAGLQCNDNVAGKIESVFLDSADLEMLVCN
jgi:hypothetical protein